MSRSRAFDGGPPPACSPVPSYLQIPPPSCASATPAGPENQLRWRPRGVTAVHALERGRMCPLVIKHTLAALNQKELKQNSTPKAECNQLNMFF